LPDDQVGELVGDGPVQGDDAAVGRNRIGGERALVCVLDRARYRNTARISVLDDHARGGFELTQAEPRRVQVVQVVERELAAVQLLDLREQVARRADLRVVGRALV